MYEGSIISNSHVCIVAFKRGNFNINILYGFDGNFWIFSIEISHPLSLSFISPYADSPSETHEFFFCVPRHYHRFFPFWSRSLRLIVNKSSIFKSVSIHWFLVVNARFTFDVECLLFIFSSLIILSVFEALGFDSQGLWQYVKYVWSAERDE